AYGELSPPVGIEAGKGEAEARAVGGGERFDAGLGAQPAPEEELAVGGIPGVGVAGVAGEGGGEGFPAFGGADLGGVSPEIEYTAGSGGGALPGLCHAFGGHEEVAVGGEREGLGVAVDGLAAGAGGAGGFVAGGAHGAQDVVAVLVVGRGVVVGVGEGDDGVAEVGFEAE